MAPKQMRGQTTAEHVLDTAQQLFDERGERGLTVAALTQATGVSTGSVYHHFGSLTGVTNALAVRWLGMLFTELSANLTATDDARTGVRTIVETYLRFMQDRPDVARLLHSATFDQYGYAQGKALRDNQEARLAPIEAWIRECQQRGELAPLPEPLLEAIVLGPVVGFVRRWVAYDDVDLDDAIQRLPDRIWRAVAP